MTQPRVGRYDQTLGASGHCRTSPQARAMVVTSEAIGDIVAVVAVTALLLLFALLSRNGLPPIVAVPHL